MGLLPEIRKDLASVLHFPLAAWCLMIQLVTLASCIFNMITVLNTKYMWWSEDGNKGYLGPEDATMLTFISLLIALNLCGILGILLRWTFGLRTIGIGFKIILISMIVTLITTLLVWFFTACKVGGGSWSEVGTNIYDDLVYLALSLLVIALAAPTLSGIKSLRYVIAYGGTGWEKLNYIDMRNVRKTEAYLDIIQ